MYGVKIFQITEGSVDSEMTITTVFDVREVYINVIVTYVRKNAGRN